MLETVNFLEEHVRENLRSHRLGKEVPDTPELQFIKGEKWVRQSCTSTHRMKKIKGRIADRGKFLQKTSLVKVRHLWNMHQRYTLIHLNNKQAKIILKCGKYLHRNFTPKWYWMANEHLERWSVPLIMKERYIKPTARYLYLAYLNGYAAKGKQQIQRRMWRKRALILLVGWEAVQPLWKLIWQLLTRFCKIYNV